jgi:hypothetical protein
MSVGDAYCQADIDWERYSGQEGWTGRDEMILMKREGIFRMDGERCDE